LSTLLLSICASGENRSPSSVRLYAGQSPGGVEIYTGGNRQDAARRGQSGLFAAIAAGALATPAARQHRDRQ